MNKMLSAHTPFALSLSKGLRAATQGFDKLSPNGWAQPSPPFSLSLSKGPMPLPFLDEASHA
ncbi:MAG TPA: hypothetical protein VLA61_05965 [Ideonella sp.]|uniref:hypothetical protein n=1 Tax=Ideonella sp. TaxID=1929293 RepID=UPI002C57ABA7|nr:hypothetical protein [Ideonella sp.]HSI47793.1 hypothetical protein [Ideonella sp.]